MTGRDDFPADISEAIRRRVGGRCSMPNCRAATTGPSDSRVSGVTNVGVAAHITAAASGGPRYDPDMTSEQRRSRENGIWVCQTHGKMIDDDEYRYTVDLLRGWRDLAEAKAKEELGRPVVSLGRPGIVRHQAVVVPDGERQGTAYFVEDIAAQAAWGRQRSELVWMVLYELALNATTHGGAAEVMLRSRLGHISLSYCGPPFGLNDLLQSEQRGGGAAVRALRDTADGLLDLNYLYQDNRNEWRIIDNSQANAADDPCSVRLEPKGAEKPFTGATGCDEIHIYADGLWSFSDAYRLARIIPADIQERQFIVHGIASDQFLASELRSLLTRVRFADPIDLP